MRIRETSSKIFLEHFQSLVTYERNLGSDQALSCHLMDDRDDRDQKVGKAETYQFFLIRSQFLLTC